MKVQPDGRHSRNGWTRPVALSDEFDGVQQMEDGGIVSLPNHVFWSGPARTWNLNDRHQRIQVYELVLTEGTEEDVRRFIDLEVLMDLWADLWLPAHVRIAWSQHIRNLRGVVLAC